MEDEGGRVVVTLTLPAAAPEPGSILTFRSPEFLVYSSGVPDFTEIMMREVVQFFGEKEETHS